MGVLDPAHHPNDFAWSQPARRLGISKSEFVKDSLARTLGLINPADLLDQIRTGSPSGKSDLSETVSKTMKRKLRAKHSD